MRFKFWKKKPSNTESAVQASVPAAMPTPDELKTQVIDIFKGYIRSESLSFMGTSKVASFFGRAFTLHLGRHHVSTAREVIADFADKNLDQMLQYLENAKTENQARVEKYGDAYKAPKADGSYMRRIDRAIELIKNTEVMSKEIFELPEGNPATVVRSSSYSQ